jgi:hypothetical protein
MKMSPYVDYWEDILSHLSKPLPLQRSTLLEGFWPSNNWRFNYAKVELLSTNQVIDLEDLVMCPYYGPKNLTPAPTYTPFRELNMEILFL